MSLEPYKVYAIKYATLQKQASENFIGGVGGGDLHEGPMPMDYFVWLAQNATNTWVIDTGFNADMALKRGRDFLRCPGEGLRLLGVNPETVSNVIVTHLHYDHIGNFQLFPQARFHLQEAEMAYATGRHMGNSFLSGAYEVDDVVGMVRRVYEGRVEFHKGDTQLAEGLSVHWVGGHTLGLQVVRVWTQKGWLVLASDASHYSANMKTGRPFPIVASIPQMVSGWQRIRELADKAELIIPGHDPQVMQQFPVAGDGLDGIAVRLDC